MRIGSLFAGLGGLDLACEWAFNGRTVWQLDQVGAKVRARHWPPSRTLPDGPPCPGRPAQIRALGNAVVPQQGALAIRTALQPAQVGLFGAA